MRLPVRENQATQNVESNFFLWLVYATYKNERILQF